MAAGRRAVFIDRDGTLNEMVYDEMHGLLDSPRKPEQVVLTPLDHPTAAGSETVQFVAALNAGSELRPLSRIASGGIELHCVEPSSGK